MARRFLSLLVLALLLTACAPAAVPEQAAGSPTQAYTSTAPPVPQPSPTNTQPPATQTASPSPSPAPTRTPTLQPTADLNALLDPGAQWYGLVRDLNSGQVLFESQPDARFHPASMIKIPLAMAVLQTLERRGLGLDALARENIDRRTLRQLLRAAVVVSEEEAAQSLLDYLNQQGGAKQILADWGLADTSFAPRRTTANDLAAALEGLYRGQMLNPDFTAYLLALMAEQTQNDTTLLGAMLPAAPGAVFYNKRGTLTSPTIVADMGILVDGERVLVLVLCGTPKADGSVTYEAIQASIEQFARQLQY